LLELFAPFAHPDAWITFGVLIFLELILGIDNLVFIAITTDRLPQNKQHIGRRIGLCIALIMRIAFLCTVFWIGSQTETLIQLPLEVPRLDLGLSARDLILLIGGTYLIIKGIQEIRTKLALKEELAKLGSSTGSGRCIGLLRATATIAVMDIVFSIDSVITAVGLANRMFLVMILAVMIAVFVMIIFADLISSFVNTNPEIKILALVFIIAVGLKLVVESLGLEVKIEGLNIEVFDVVLYFAMAFSLVITTIQMLYNRRLKKLRAKNR